SISSHSPYSISGQKHSSVRSRRSTASRTSSRRAATFLNSSRVWPGSFGTRPPVDLRLLAGELSAEWQVASPSHTLVVEMPEGSLVEADRVRVTQVLSPEQRLQTLHANTRRRGTCQGTRNRTVRRL